VKAENSELRAAVAVLRAEAEHKRRQAEADASAHAAQVGRVGLFVVLKRLAKKERRNQDKKRRKRL
jgi:hypothetical protein